MLVELKKLADKSRNHRSDGLLVESYQLQKKGSSQAEEYLVKSILADKKVLELVRQALEPEEFLDPILRSIVEVCFKYWDEFGDFKLPKVLTSVNDVLANKISQYVVEDFYPEDEVLKETILNLKRKFQKTKTRKLKEQIRIAEEAKDARNLSILINEYQKHE